MNAFELLSQHHREIDRLLDRLQKAGEKGGDDPKDLFGRFRKELELHTRLEEEVYYLEMQKYPKTKSMVADALQEHNEMRLLVERATGFSVEAKEWWELINELKLVFQEHVHGEEGQLFPAAGKKLDQRVVDELGGRMQAIKQQASA